MSVIDVLFDIPGKLADLADALFEFLFQTITIGDFSVSFWAIFGGVSIVGLIVLSLFWR